jgi:hypothetical protein
MIRILTGLLLFIFALSLTGCPQSTGEFGDIIAFPTLVEKDEEGNLIKSIEEDPMVFTGVFTFKAVEGATYYEIIVNGNSIAHIENGTTSPGTAIEYTLPDDVTLPCTEYDGNRVKTLKYTIRAYNTFQYVDSASGYLTIPCTADDLTITEIEYNANPNTPDDWKSISEIPNPLYTSCFFQLRARIQASDGLQQLFILFNDNAVANMQTFNTGFYTPTDYTYEVMLEIPPGGVRTFAIYASSLTGNVKLSNTVTVTSLDVPHTLGRTDGYQCGTGTCTDSLMLGWVDVADYDEYKLQWNDSTDFSGDVLKEATAVIGSAEFPNPEWELTGLTPGQYYFRVLGCKAGICYDCGLACPMEVGYHKLLPKPTLSLPCDGQSAGDTGQRVNLFWDAPKSELVEKIKVEVAITSNFDQNFEYTSQEFVKENPGDPWTTTSDFALQSPPPPDENTPGPIYYWRVKNFSMNEICVATSDVCSFEFRPIPCDVQGPPTDLNPPNNSVIPGTPRLTWEKPVGAQQVQVELYDSSGNLLGSKIRGASYVAVEDLGVTLEADTQYYWRARGVKGQPCGDWSEDKYFEIRLVDTSTKMCSDPQEITPTGMLNGFGYSADVELSPDGSKIYVTKACATETGDSSSEVYCFKTSDMTPCDEGATFGRPEFGDGGVTELIGITVDPTTGDIYACGAGRDVTGKSANATLVQYDSSFNKLNDWGLANVFGPMWWTTSHILIASRFVQGSGIAPLEALVTLAHSNYTGYVDKKPVIKPAPAISGISEIGVCADEEYNQTFIGQTYHTAVAGSDDALNLYSYDASSESNFPQNLSQKTEPDISFPAACWGRFGDELHPSTPNNYLVWVMYGPGNGTASTTRIYDVSASSADGFYEVQRWSTQHSLAMTAKENATSDGLDIYVVEHTQGAWPNYKEFTVCRFELK